MENKGKKSFGVESGISNDELFAILDGIDSGGESHVDNVLGDSDTEFVNDKPISKIADDTHNLLVPEVNLHMESEQMEPQQEDHEVLPKKRKSQLIYDIKWSSRKTKAKKIELM